MSIGDKIKQARLAVNMTQAELAKKLGVAYQNIGQWETGKRKPKPETLMKLGEALGVSWLWFTGSNLCSEELSPAHQSYTDFQIQNQSAEYVRKIISICFGPEQLKTHEINYSGHNLSVSYSLYSANGKSIALFSDEESQIVDITVDLIKSLVQNIGLTEQAADKECINIIEALKQEISVEQK